jgi:D-alanyl-D-alanine carboxypeptidase
MTLDRRDLVMTRRIPLLLVLALLVGACADDGPAEADPPATSAATSTSESTGESTTTAAPEPEPELLATFPPRFDEALAAEFAASPELRGMVALVRTDDGFSWTGAEGDATSDASFRIASVTKTFTAASVLRLSEQGAFGLDDPISTVLLPDTTTLLANGGYDPSAITVRHLLTHTAGLFDFSFGPGVDYLGRVFADPLHRWTRREQLELAMQGTPVGPPGGQFHYSDTAYSLLGEIVEEATGDTLGASMRELLRFDELGIEHTYQESIDPVPSGQPPRLHQWFGDVDTYDWDPSLDLYGGGGLVSTAPDLATFYEALLDGRVFDDPATLAEMLSVPPTNEVVSVPGSPAAPAAAAGIFRLDVEGNTCWGHEGFWGVQVLRCPDLGLTLVASRSQVTPPPSYTGEPFGSVLYEAMVALGG